MTQPGSVRNNGRTSTSCFARLLMLLYVISTVRRGRYRLFLAASPDDEKKAILAVVVELCLLLTRCVSYGSVSHHHDHH